MTATPEWLCECGWVLRRIPVAAEESETVRPAHYLLTCRNVGCEHHGKQFKEPGLRIVTLREAGTGRNDVTIAVAAV